MIAKNEYFNFIEGSTTEIIGFKYSLEGDSNEIDFIDFGNCPCTSGAYNDLTNMIVGTINLGMVGVGKNTPGGTKFISKYIKVLLDPDQPERIRRSELDVKDPLYDKDSYGSVINPLKRIITLTLAGDVKYEKT